MTKGLRVFYFSMFLLEATLFFLSFFLFFLFFTETAVADVNETVEIEGLLEIGASAPTIIGIEIHDGSVTLLANSTRIVNCTVEIEDFDTDVDIVNVTAEFFDNTASFHGDADDNNHHYTNTSCYIDTGYGDVYTALAHCLFDVQYYANAGTWNCSAYVLDNSSYFHNESNTTEIQPLLAIGMPDVIDYGTVNATFASDENMTNITNFGNVQINLSLSGYAIYEDDNLSMNCTMGFLKNISIGYEKYNLTTSNLGILNLAAFEANYSNLTGNATVKEFNLDYNQNDTDNEAVNTTYWRIYVPDGIAGSCQGTIIVGATQAGGG